MVSGNNTKLYFDIEQKIVPGLKYSQYFYEELLKECVLNKVWLDAGCGHRILPEWRRNEELKLVKETKVYGSDIDIKSLLKHNSLTKLTLSNLEQLPFKSKSFDVVTSNMVIEHLKKPAEVFKEFNRVTKKNGHLIIHTPNVYGYTTVLSRLIPEKYKAKIVEKIHPHRTDEDAFHTFYRANSRKTLDSCFVKAGFKQVKMRTLLSSAQTTFVPIAIFELFILKLLKLERFANFRLTLLALYQKVS